MTHEAHPDPHAGHAPAPDAAPRGTLRATPRRAPAAASRRTTAPSSRARSHAEPSPTIDFSDPSDPSDLADPSDLLAQAADLRAQLAELEAQYLRAHRLATLGTLAASVAHEVNNLLTPILSYAQLALAAPHDAELTRKALLRASDCAEKASRIGSAMLGFARLDEHDSPGPAETCVAAPGPARKVHAPPPPRPSANIADAVDNAIACLGRDPRKDGIALTIDIPPHLHAAIAPVALQQVFLNLALNARRALRARPGAHITVSARGTADARETPAEGSTGNVQITFADNGPGIPAPILARLFQPFASQTSPIIVQALAQVNQPRETDPVPRSGTGLGLAVTHTLITRARGSIHAESSPARGTRFTITLPAADPPQPD